MKHPRHETSRLALLHVSERRKAEAAEKHCEGRATVPSRARLAASRSARVVVPLVAHRITPSIISVRCSVQKAPSEPTA